MSGPPSPIESLRQIGDHRIAMDGDIVSVRLCGPLTTEQAQQLIAFAAHHVRGLPGFFLLLDLRDMGAPPPSDARRVLVQWTTEQPPRAAAAIGGNVVVRALATLASRATNLLSKRPHAMNFFAEEADARAWFDTARRSNT